MKIKTSKIPIVLNDPNNPPEGVQLGAAPGQVMIRVRQNGTEMELAIPVDEATGIAVAIIQLGVRAQAQAQVAQQGGQTALGSGLITQ